MAGPPSARHHVVIKAASGSSSSSGDAVMATTAKDKIHRRRKVHTPKVRTGCVTCKNRRVKCDEAKPICLRCQNSGVECLGYKTPKAWIFESERPGDKDKTVVTTNTNPLITTLTRDQNSSLQLADGYHSSTNNSGSNSKQPSLGASPSWHLLDSVETRALQFYLRRSGLVVAKLGAPRFLFWTKTIPQAVHSYPSVKEAIVAITLLDELITSPPTTAAASDDVLKRRAENHMQASLRYLVYTKPSIECTLLTNMLLNYFEHLAGNVETAAFHLSSAKKIVKIWRSNAGEKAVTAGEKARLNTSEGVECTPGVMDEILNESLKYFDEVNQNEPPRAELLRRAEEDWTTMVLPLGFECEEDAEHSLTATICNFGRMAGRSPLALIRAKISLATWLVDVKDLHLEKQQAGGVAHPLMTLYALASGLYQFLSSTKERERAKSRRICEESIILLAKKPLRYHRPIQAALLVVRPVMPAPSQPRLRMQLVEQCACSSSSS